MVSHSRASQEYYKAFPFRQGRNLRWNEFVQAFEKFTDLLVVSARDGCTDKLDAEYQLLRKWLVKRYSRFGRYLLPYLGSLPISETEVAGNAGRRNIRRFLKLPALIRAIYHAGTIRDLLRIDSGDLISNVSRFSDAVYRCDQELTTDG